MSELLTLAPYGPRDDAQFLTEMTALSRHHLNGCVPYRQIWPDWEHAHRPADLPWLHVGLFKLLQFRTDAEGLQHQRVLHSSSTSGQGASQVVLDARSARLQGQSSVAILQDFIGAERRPLVVLDSAKALRSAQMSARIAAALSLRPLASDLHFVLDDVLAPTELHWQQLLTAVQGTSAAIIYGFTYLLWQAWTEVPAEVRAVLRTKQLHFVHSGGWKKLESAKVDHIAFSARLLADAGPGSAVTDYYGLVEQVGVVYPLCSHGFRHVPVWAEVIVRDPWTLEPLIDTPGQLQSMNTLAWGAPYHNVLTEDMAKIVPGTCPCGRQGTRFELLGRMPKAEVRGCANV